MLLYGQLCYWKLYVIVSGQLCYWEFCGNQIFPNSYTWDQSTIFDWEFLQRKLCKFENSSKKKDTRPEQWQPSLVLMGLWSKQNMYAHMHHVCLSGMYMIKQKTIQTIIQIKNIWIEQRQIVRACKYENCHRGKFIHLSQISLFIRPKSAIKREKFLSNLYNNRIFQRNELLLTPLSCQIRGFSVFFFILTDHTCHRHCRPFPSVKDYRLQCIRISLSPPWPLFGNIFWHHCSGASPFSNLYLRNLTAKKARLQSMQQIFYRKRNFGISYKNTRTEEDVWMPTVQQIFCPLSMSEKSC